MERRWTRTSEEAPPENVLIVGMSPNGLEQKLKRVGHLWFVEAGDLYVYYTPEFWSYPPGGEDEH